ncbi:MAG: hypothetical protein EBQ56_09255 [Proteobacteria bacterium]|nr:hypothetical protein [Pseudomonadota bacterium]HAH16845.1 hypothetical protein [Chloroflexota bacterium]NBQ30698.1 hypothetical protein [Pseudomonadota bacterium]NBT02184.1 hypothetical protein [Pseudomonadota bacterium]NBY47943.1 hypothetical protein [Pseudomonadota bacterium]
MVLSEARSGGFRVVLAVPPPHVFHPAEVRQLRTRFEELREEQQSWIEPVFRRSIAREVRRLRRILQTLDAGNAVVTPGADRAA